MEGSQHKARLCSMLLLLLLITFQKHHLEWSVDTKYREATLWTENVTDGDSEENVQRTEVTDLTA